MPSRILVVDCLFIAFSGNSSEGYVDNFCVKGDLFSSYFKEALIFLFIECFLGLKSTVLLVVWFTLDYDSLFFKAEELFSFGRAYLNLANLISVNALIYPFSIDKLIFSNTSSSVDSLFSSSLMSLPIILNLEQAFPKYMRKSCCYKSYIFLISSPKQSWSIIIATLCPIAN